MKTQTNNLVENVKEFSQMHQIKSENTKQHHHFDERKERRSEKSEKVTKKIKMAPAMMS